MTTMNLIEIFREEADIFYEDSQSWLEQNYPMETPEILLYFDVLQQNIMRYYI